MDKPYRIWVKLIRTIESCKTIGQLNVARQMWWNTNNRINNNDTYREIHKIYKKKLNELQEKENADSE